LFCLEGLGLVDRKNLHCAACVKYRVGNVIVSVEVRDCVHYIGCFFVISFFRLFWGEKIAMGAIDLAKVRKKYPVVG
jgi:hypothetical protein